MQEYEANASKHTEEGLQQLLDYLQYNPTVYYDILAKRSREESDNAGLFSYLRNRITEWYTGGADAGGSVDPEEAKRQLSGLKNSIVKSFNYSQGSFYYFCWTEIVAYSFCTNQVNEVEIVK